MSFKESFIGFTLDKTHSSDLGILRTYNNSLEITLLPELEDCSIEIPGQQGSVFCSTEFGKRTFVISFSFFGFSEQQFRKLKQILCNKDTHQLILDEEPYKVWTVRLAGSATSKKICFQDNHKRFYCGSGELTFISTFPYARSRYEYLEDYNGLSVPEWVEDENYLFSEDKDLVIYPALLTYDFPDSDSATIQGVEEQFNFWLKNEDLLLLDEAESDLIGVNSVLEIFSYEPQYSNMEEWREASGIPSNQEYGKRSAGNYHLYNAGDVAMPFSAIIPINQVAKTITINSGLNSLTISNIVSKNTSLDKYVLIDTNSETIMGLDENKQTTNNIYNSFITQGSFFKLPLGEADLQFSEDVLLFYKYLYI